MHGFQDLSLAVKLRAFRAPLGDGALSGLVVGAAGTPASGYSPDFLPLSIGLGSRSAAARLTLSWQTRQGWFLDASGAHTWRGKVKLDRPAYYTDGELHLSDEVAMPRVVDFSLRTGFRGARLHLPLSLTRQRTLGGGDIRRQDMPFVSNRMDFVRVDGAVAYVLPRLPRLSARVGGGRVLSGRNVGQATTFHAGLQYTILSDPQAKP
jgi:hypothetical protein